MRIASFILALLFNAQLNFAQEALSIIPGKPGPNFIIGDTLNSYFAKNDNYHQSISIWSDSTIMVATSYPPFGFSTTITKGGKAFIHGDTLEVSVAHRDPQYFIQRLEGDSSPEKIPIEHTQAYFKIQQARLVLIGKSEDFDFDEYTLVELDKK